MLIEANTPNNFFDPNIVPEKPPEVFMVEKLDVLPQISSADISPINTVIEQKVNPEGIMFKPKEIPTSTSEFPPGTVIGSYQIPEVFFDPAQTKRINWEMLVDAVCGTKNPEDNFCAPVSTSLTVNNLEKSPTREEIKITWMKFFEEKGAEIIQGENGEQIVRITVEDKDSGAKIAEMRFSPNELNSILNLLRTTQLEQEKFDEQKSKEFWPSLWQKTKCLIVILSSGLGGVILLWKMLKSHPSVDHQHHPSPPSKTDEDLITEECLQEVIDTMDLSDLPQGEVETPQEQLARINTHSGGGHRIIDQY